MRCASRPRSCAPSLPAPTASSSSPTAPPRSSNRRRTSRCSRTGGAITPRPRTVEFDRGANLLGALSLAVSDRMSDAISAAAEQSERPGSETAAEALSALHHFLARPSIDRLRTVLGLTSSGTVRLVDRLEQAGYVERRPGEDGRTTVVTLTAVGERMARRVSDAREAV